MKRSQKALRGILKIGPSAFVCFLVLSLQAFAFPPQTQNAREIAQKAFPSVVMLVMDDKNGNPLTLGSGFFVKDGVIATNMHVIEGADGGHAKLIGQKDLIEQRGAKGSVGGGGRSRDLGGRRRQRRAEERRV